MRAAKHAPCGPFRVLECLHGLAEVVECGAFVIVERPRVSMSHYEQELITFAENASRHGYRFAHQ